MTLNTITQTTKLAGRKYVHNGDDLLKFTRDAINVKTIGAVGDGVADDTAAIQSAVDTVVSYVRQVGKPRRIYFPSGQYKLTATIDLNDVADSISFLGEGRWSQIVGNIEGGYLFDRDGSTLTDGPNLFDGLHIINQADNGSDTDAGSIRFLGANQVIIRDCGIYTTGGVGLALYNGNFSSTVHSTYIHGNGNLGVGLLANGHIDVRACDFAGFDEAVRACGAEVNINACRAEVCNTAFHLGADTAGAAYTMNSGSLIGCVTEACGTGLYGHALAGTIVAGNIFTSNDLVYDPEYGMRFLYVETSPIIGNSVSGIYQTAGFAIDASPSRCAFMNNYANITSGGGVGWLVNGSASLTDNVFLLNTGTGVPASRLGTLPTSDPAVAGALWNNAGTMKISTG